MYEYINGLITDIGADFVVSDCGGVGYLIYCSTNTLKTVRIGEKKKLYIYFHVSEDANLLYGFATDDEREMFKNLMGVSRIGRKLALGILSVMTPADVAMAVSADNAAAFDGVSGLGRKTAQRVILELKEKVAQTGASAYAGADSGDAGVRAEAIDALCALGYDGLSAGRAVGDAGEFSGVEDLIKKALAILARG